MDRGGNSVPPPVAHWPRPTTVRHHSRHSRLLCTWAQVSPISMVSVGRVPGAVKLCTVDVLHPPPRGPLKVLHRDALAVFYLQPLYPPLHPQDLQTADLSVVSKIWPLWNVIKMESSSIGSLDWTFPLSTMPWKQSGWYALYFCNSFVFCNSFTEA